MSRNRNTLQAQIRDLPTISLILECQRLVESCPLRDPTHKLVSMLLEELQERFGGAQATTSAVALIMEEPKKDDAA